MDLYCPNCGEPWDNDCIHEEVSERADGSTYRTVLREFQAVGCKALTVYGEQECVASGSERAAVASAMYDLLGDDADGAMAMMQDFGY